MVCGCGLWVWLLVCPFSEVILYSRWRSGANVLSVVRSIAVVRISEVENTLYIYGDSGLCHRLCSLFRGCPLLGGSVNRGFTVFSEFSFHQIIQHIPIQFLMTIIITTSFTDECPTRLECNTF